MNQHSRRPKLKMAFFSMGMWHIWDALRGDSSNGYDTAQSRQEMFTMLYDQGYELVAVAPRGETGEYFFRRILND